MPESRAPEPARHRPGDGSDSPWTPGFRRFFAGQSLSWLSSSMVPLALSFGVLRATGDAGALGIVLAASSIPMVLLLLLGGVVADRCPCGPLLVLTHLLAGLAQALAACWFLLDWTSVGLLALFAALGGAASAFTGPALRGLITDLVAPSALARANAARGAARNATRLVGPGISGLIVALVGAGSVLAADAACLVLAALIFTTLPGLPHDDDRGENAAARGPTRASGRLLTAIAAAAADLRDGAHEVISRRWLWMTSAAFFVVNVMIGGIWLVLGPLAAAMAPWGAAGWGIVLGARAGGQLLGAGIAYRLRVRRPLLWVLLGTLPYTAAFAGIGLGLPVGPLAALAAIAGLFSAISGVTWETALAQHVPSRAISRVSSVDMMISFCSIPLGQLLAPAAARACGIETVALLGAVVTVIALLAPLAAPSVRSVRAA